MFAPLGAFFQEQSQVVLILFYHNIKDLYDYTFLLYAVVTPLMILGMIIGIRAQSYLTHLPSRATHAHFLLQKVETVVQ